ncbi:hemolysin III family protein [uncultured Chloroflexus sp.]|uniref:PAQR family membrane homeostasis protein TrhA n=1 Tax=uncultured Chloroflexus sp. TaxID=214040 RepID=UPI00261F9C42|nr:hemolysin III family protein [uncultured Chloroflexus sp.]
MTTLQPTEHFSPHEELINVITHGAGAALSTLAGAILLGAVWQRGDGWQIAGATIFCVTLTLLYLASTLYHASREPRRRAILEIFDHSAIFFLIAGTYTPFTLVSLRGTLGWTIFGLVWGLALAGVVMKLFLTGRFRLLSTLIYVALGWLVVIAADQVFTALNPPTIGLLVAGGVAYTAGTPFYMLSQRRYMHNIWHGFVLLGSVLHFGAVVSVVL